MTQRIERINDRRLRVANHPHFHEVDAKRGEILRDVPYVLVLGASRQDLIADYEHAGGD